ncbi:unnamed protein product, partial [Brassica oleracea]
EDSAINLRSLGKQFFLPFLNKSISILPKRLSASANSDNQSRDSTRDLFRAYELCLESFSAQLACKPHTVQLQAWGFYECVNTQAFKFLEKLRGSDVS